MDLGGVIFGTILLALCIVPFAIMHYNRVKKENKLFQALNGIAKQDNCQISQHEFCGDFVLGIDKNRNYVFFIKQEKEQVISHYIDLSEIQTCQVIKKTRSVKNENETSSIIERIELIFISMGQTNAEPKFELYDEEINVQLSGELFFADKWSKQINERLKNKK